MKQGKRIKTMRFKNRCSRYRLTFESRLMYLLLTLGIAWAIKTSQCQIYLNLIWFLNGMFMSNQKYNFILYKVKTTSPEYIYKYIYHFFFLGQSYSYSMRCHIVRIVSCLSKTMMLRFMLKDVLVRYWYNISYRVILVGDGNKISRPIVLKGLKLF